MVDTQKNTAAIKPDGPVRRALKNAVWLLAGKGVGGVFSLVYMGLVARSLGAEQFGIFALILAYVQAIAALAKFESWQTVIRYGAAHLEENRPQSLRRILNFSMFLDAGSALVGAIIGIIGVYIIGPLLGWSETEETIAAYSCVLLLFNIRGTPLGILRLFDRFDIAAFSEAVLPSVRLVGALIAWSINASVFSYMLVWVLAELITAVAIWWAALRELRIQKPEVRSASAFDVKGVREENEGLWPFAWTTNLDFSFKQVWKHLPVLIVGWSVDAIAAGGFRIASNLVNALSKPSMALAWAVFPELAKLKVTDPEQIKYVVKKTTLASTLAGGIALVLMFALGRQALWVLGGDEFLFAYPIVLMLAVAAMLELCGLTLESAIVALGFPGAMLIIRTMVGIAYAILLFTMVPAFGIHGGGAAAICASAFLLLLIILKFRSIAKSVA
ncbi:MAG: oligosaccharide flippase family protein [Pseudomonadota bacterium]